MSSLLGKSKCTERNHAEASTVAPFISTNNFVSFIAKTKVNQDLQHIKNDAIFPPVFIYLFIHYLQTLPISFRSSADIVGTDKKNCM